jgi:hypothetical protein
MIMMRNIQKVASQSNERSQYSIKPFASFLVASTENL